MVRLYFIVIVFLFMSCGTIKNTTTASENSNNENILPPNTASNKYSKKRIRN